MQGLLNTAKIYAFVPVEYSLLFFSSVASFNYLVVTAVTLFENNVLSCCLPKVLLFWSQGLMSFFSTKLRVLISDGLHPDPSVEKLCTAAMSLDGDW